MKDERSASEQIDAIISSVDDWRGKKLLHLRDLILKADSSVIEEVKWKKPSKPEGVAVWSQNGIVCVADILKNAVRLTFPKGAQVNDPQKLFNTRLDSASVRAIDFFADDSVDESGLQGLVLEVIKINTQKK